MLAYIIVRELKRLLRNLDITIKEAVEELSVVTSDEVKIGRVSYQQIPEPRELGIKILETCMVRLPKALPYRGINVATKKKLVDRRR